MPGLQGDPWGPWGANHPMRYPMPYLVSARRPRMGHANYFGSSMGASGADHPEEYTSPYLGSARRPKMRHHAMTGA